MRRWRNRLEILVLLAALLAGGCATAPKAPPVLADVPIAERPTHNRRLYEQAWQLVNAHFYDKNFKGVDWVGARERHRAAAEAASGDEQLYTAINALLAELKSSHTEASSPAQRQKRKLRQALSAGFISVEQSGQPRLVVEVIAGSPAEVAGVKVGWIVLAEPVQVEPESVRQPGSTVRIQFKDENDQPRTLELEQRTVSYPHHLDARVLPGDFLYLRFDGFNGASQSFVRAQLRAHREAPGVIVDLRFNGGGWDSTLRGLFNEFFDHAVDAGTVIDRRHTGKMGGWPWWDWRSGTVHYRGGLAVLVTDSSYSCSEIFADTVQRSHRGLVVGPCDTGGAVEGSEDFQLLDGGKVKVAFQRYLSPAGKPLEGIGVAPDIVAPPITAADLRAGMDTHIKTALTALQNSPARPKP